VAPISSGLGAQILSGLGFTPSNHPCEVVGLETYGIEIVEQVPA
jgi:GTP cyclohydrolase II